MGRLWLRPWPGAFRVLRRPNMWWHLLSYIAGILSAVGIVLLLRRSQGLDELDRINAEAREKLDEALQVDMQAFEQAKEQAEAAHQNRLEEDEEELVRHSVEAADAILQKRKGRRRNK